MTFTFERFARAVFIRTPAVEMWGEIHRRWTAPAIRKERGEVLVDFGPLALTFCPLPGKAQHSDQQ
jgi:hypothetical protein